MTVNQKFISFYPSRHFLNPYPGHSLIHKDQSGMCKLFTNVNNTDILKSTTSKKNNTIHGIIVPYV